MPAHGECARAFDSAIIAKTQQIGLIPVPSIRAGAWRLVIIPGDHEPRHVHARRGSQNALNAVIILEVDGRVTLRKADRALSRSDIREARELVLEHFEELVALWEKFCQ